MAFSEIVAMDLGPMTRTVTDAALMLQVIAGYDSRDTASLDLHFAGLT
jgi:Asp-tRNA(Asn)/Glu-tRNA(Gln) amidotransferase A subunit family amidase